MWPLSYPTRRACRYAACVSGVLHTWDFALYLAGNDSYRDNILPSGLPTGAPEEALDCAGDLYLNPRGALTRSSSGTS